MQYVLKLNGSGEGQSLTANSLQTPDREDGLMDTLYCVFSFYIITNIRLLYQKGKRQGQRRIYHGKPSPGPKRSLQSSFQQMASHVL